MKSPPANALPVGRLSRLTIPDVPDRIQITARIVTAEGEWWVKGTAHAWTRDSVQVWWCDPTDLLRRIDWFPANDIRRVS